jgi:UDP-N-acetylmuramate dehydrogenase
LFCIQNSWQGIENLSLIPGKRRGFPHAKYRRLWCRDQGGFSGVECFSPSRRRVFINSTSHDCEFGYRESVFKTKYKNQFVILDVTYRLNKIPKYNTTYGAVEKRNWSG